MESPYQARKIIAVLLLLLFLGALGWAGWMQYRSPMVQSLTAHAEEPLEITILTDPIMFVSYTPSSRQAHVRLLSGKKQIKDPQERAKQLLAAEKINIQTPFKYFIPNQTKWETFWEDFKQSLARWRYNPLLVIRTAGSYISALHQRRTNLSVAEAALLALELTQLEANDFTVKLPQKQRKKKESVADDFPEQTSPDHAPLALQDRPILVEVLNASGQKGLALELTQFLRDQNAKGLLRVDVLQYDNYPTQQDSSWIENYSGQPVALKQLGNAIGITGEIRVGSAPNVICDTRIILGKDFKMPL